MTSLIDDRKRKAEKEAIDCIVRLGLLSADWEGRVVGGFGER